ncbi:LemA family protein [Luteimonas sp. RIT-PG2_3]
MISLVTVLLALAVVGLLAWSLWTYNGFIRLRNQVATAWADIDVQLMRRHDLVPQLVSAVQGYIGHERATLELVTQLRAKAIQATAPAALGDVEHALSQAIGQVLVLQEAYPDLKASANFIQLQRDLVDVEEQLQYARRFYNGAVRDYNDAIQRVPANAVASMTGFDAREPFQAGDSARNAVQVELAR